MHDLKPSEMAFSFQLSRPEDELCDDAWHVFMISKALRASGANGRNSFSPMFRAFERFLPSPLPNARKLYRRLIRSMRRACMPLRDLLSRVYEVSMVQLSNMTASHRYSRDDGRRVFANWVNQSMIRLTRFLAIYRFLRELQGAQMGENFSISTLWRVHLQSL
jgi:hypothetical protein